MSTLSLEERVLWKVLELTALGCLADMRDFCFLQRLLYLFVLRG